MSPSGVASKSPLLYHRNLGLGLSCRKVFRVLDSENILAIISKEAAVDRSRLAPGATLEELAIASLDVINILFAIEDECGVELEPQEFENARTLQQFMDAILAKTAQPKQEVSQS